MNNKKHQLNTLLSGAEQRATAMRVSHVGQQILNNSIQKRVDSRTIILIRKKQ